MRCALARPKWQFLNITSRHSEVLVSCQERRKARPVMDSILQLEGLLRDVAEHLRAPTKSSARAAALKLKRISEIATTLALTIHLTVPAAR